jgi:phosphopantetheinyl transferase (holo-ACP synthase)
VSLSHTSRACLVAVAAAGSPVGGDFEDLGRIQQPELIVETLTARERATLEGLAGAEFDERLLRLWCAKEAAAKFLGVGLQGQPEAFEVRFVDATCERALVVFENATVELRTVRVGASVIAVAAANPPPQRFIDGQIPAGHDGKHGVRHRQGSGAGLGPGPAAPIGPATMLVADLDFSSVDIQLCVALEESASASSASRTC